MAVADGSHELGDLEKGGIEAVFTNKIVTSLSWKDIHVALKDSSSHGSKIILEGATGYALPGEMVAVMGPSGSGKTTLLNFLSSRKISGAAVSCTGDVLFNGAAQSLSTIRHISSYVEQDDALIGSLTTEETLRFAVRLGVPSLKRNEMEARVTEILDSFGLSASRRTIIGTPLQKGLSGGQKRRVSLASQLITAPKVLFLDEPTSGLDSTASFEVMSYLKQIVRQHNLIVIVSIHQPSTKTLRLFDKTCLLSLGATCYFGPTENLQSYFSEIGMPIPALTNPAEHILDAVNVDFRKDGTDFREIVKELEIIKNAWGQSVQRREVLRDVANLQTSDSVLALAAKPSSSGQMYILITLVHRGFLKSVRDVVAYWVRVLMYTGLAIMMGTVWLRLDTDQGSIQPFINAIFFGSAFMSFMAVAYVPAFLEDRSAFIKERANGLYGPFAFNMSNFIVGLPYLFGIVVIFSVIAYWLTNFEPTAEAFFTWIMWLYLDLLAAESMVVFFASMFPNFILSLALVAFANGLWMCVGGFLVAPTILNVFWRYVFHYIDYQAYVFQGMMVNEFSKRTYSCGNDCHCDYVSDLAAQCKIDGNAVLQAYGYATNRTGKWVGILIGITAVYRFFAWAALYLRQT